MGERSAYERHRVSDPVRRSGQFELPIRGLTGAGRRDGCGARATVRIRTDIIPDAPGAELDPPGRRLGPTSRRPAFRLRGGRRHDRAGRRVGAGGRPRPGTRPNRERRGSRPRLPKERPDPRTSLWAFRIRSDRLNGQSRGISARHPQGPAAFPPTTRTDDSVPSSVRR
jgi:hypothetical protein